MSVQSEEAGATVKPCSVARIVRPRVERGIDYGADRWLLARKGTRELIWRVACQVRGTLVMPRVHEPGELALYDWGHSILGTTLHNEGGRLSRAMCMRHSAAIDAFFGEDVAHRLHPRRTLLIEAGADRSEIPGESRSVQSEEAANRSDGSFSIGGECWPGASKLIEEAGEVLQVIGKLMGSRGDTKHWTSEDLAADLVEELADLSAAIEFFAGVNGLDVDAITRRTSKKVLLYEKWHREQEVARGTGPSPREGEQRSHAFESDGYRLFLPGEPDIDLPHTRRTKEPEPTP